MKTDILARYLKSQAELLRQKTSLERQLIEINRVLSGPGKTTIPVFRRGLNAPVAATRRRHRARNKISLMEAMKQATRVKPLDRHEILAAVKKLGYKFTTKDPAHSIGVYLYKKGQFKNVNGRFAPAK